MTNFINSQDLQEFKVNLMKNTTKAIVETRKYNHTMHVFNGAMLCVLCGNFLCYNAVPIAIAATCLACSLYVGAPMYKLVKAFIKSQFKRFKD